MVNVRHNSKTGKDYNDGNKDPAAPHNRFYTAHGSDVQKRRVIRRMEAGKKIKKTTLQKYGIEVPETKQCVKAIRGRRVEYPADRYYVRMGDPPPKPVPTPLTDIDEDPTPAITIDDSGGDSGAHVQDLLEGGDAIDATDATAAPLNIPPPPLATGSVINFDYLNNYLKTAIRGGAKECSTIPRQKSDGSVLKDKQGEVCYLKNQTLKSLQRALASLVDVIGCSNTEDIVACLRQFRSNMEKLQKEYTDPCKLTDLLGVIGSLRKYVPEFRRQMGQEILEKYQEKMIANIEACRKNDETKTRDPKYAVPKFERIEAVVPKIKQEWGEDSMEYLASYLQTKLIGLRSDLGLVRVVASEQEAKDEGAPNYYVRTKDLKKQKIVITKFKTSHDYEPYNFQLPEAVAKTIEKTFGKEQTHPPLKDRKWLLSRLDGRAFSQGAYGGLLQKAFKKVKHDLGPVGIYTIRHSMETKMIGSATTDTQGINEVATKFKHTPSMALGYPRAEREPTGTTTTTGSKGAETQEAVSSKQQAVPVPSNYTKYTTDEDDTPLKIAQKLGLDVRKLIQENQGFHPEFPKLSQGSKFKQGVFIYYNPRDKGTVSQSTSSKKKKRR